MTGSRCWSRLLMGLALCAALWGLPAREAAADPSCTATMTNLSFGQVDLVSGGTPTATATMNYSCSNDQNGTRYIRICLNIGDGSASIASGGGNWNPRILRDGSGNEMNVQFYQGGTGIIWGSSTQPVPDPYDVVVTMTGRISSNRPSVTTGSFDLRGVILSGQAALPNGAFSSSFAGNHTALRYTAAYTSNNGSNIPDCNAATTSGGTFAFSVSAEVYKSCLVSANPLDFGSVDGIPSSTNIDAQTNIFVTCSKPTAYRVLLIPSNNSTTGTSNMKGQTGGNTDTVGYQLYQNSARSQQWGNQAANSPTGTGTGAAQTLVVYGRVPGLPNVRPDNYKDTVTVSVTY